MTENKLNSQRQTLMHFWNNGVRSQTELHKITGIPLLTIKYNIQQLKKTKTTMKNLLKRWQTEEPLVKLEPLSG